MSLFHICFCGVLISDSFFSLHSLPSDVKYLEVKIPDFNLRDYYLNAKMLLITERSRVLEWPWHVFEACRNGIPYICGFHRTKLSRKVSNNHRPSEAFQAPVQSYSYLLSSSCTCPLIPTSNALFLMSSALLCWCMLSLSSCSLWVAVPGAWRI